MDREQIKHMAAEGARTCGKLTHFVSALNKLQGAHNDSHSCTITAEEADGIMWMISTLRHEMHRLKRELEERPCLANHTDPPPVNSHSVYCSCGRGGWLPI